jgi:DNA-binding NarL/FixJ family response regulator
MSVSTDIVGRDREIAALQEIVAETADGRGGLVLIAGEAGVGKTRLAEHVLRDSGLLVLRGEAAQEPSVPYGPLVAALRSYLRLEPDGLAGCGPLLGYLRVLLPELGRPARRGDRPTLFEAIRAAFAAVGVPRAAAVLLDDLHWADTTTLELLAPLATSLASEPVLILGAYRSDEVPRRHPLRRLRTELRRAGRLAELAVEPLSPNDTRILASQVLGAVPGQPLTAALFDRTQGVPFFIEELVGALAKAERVREGRFGAELSGAEELPIPETVRDAVLLRAEHLTAGARALLDVAAVAGFRFELDFVTALAEGDALEELLAGGFLVESEGRAAFRHALTREALYGDIPWTRRRALHRVLADRLEAAQAPPATVAEHWLSARDLPRARPALLSAFDNACAVHAYRDALGFGRRALEVWPEAVDDDLRLRLLERFAWCAEMNGELAEASRAWREVAEARRLLGDSRGVAESERRLANTYALTGAQDRALASRRAAADAFVASDEPAGAAAELLEASAHLDSAGSLVAALELCQEARELADRAERLDLAARSLAIEGTVRAKLGQGEEALRVARAGLALALEHDAGGAAIDAYLHLANVFENLTALPEATEAYAAAHALCETQDAASTASVCLICIAFILLQTGEWDRCLELGREIASAPNAPLGVRLATKQHVAYIAAMRGDARRARRLLDQTAGYGELHDRERWLIWEALGRGWIAELEGGIDEATERCRELVSRWGGAESRHYPLPALRWAVTFLSVHREEEDARRCAEAIAGLASETGSSEALASLAHALGEVALLDGDAEGAALHFARALELLRPLELPYDLAHTQLRAGTAFAAAEDRDAAVAHLVDAYRTARRLGARPLATRAALSLSDLGEQVEERLGRRAAGDALRRGLTRRELEVLRFVAVGRTNREIARELYLSIRTVDMHVRNVLAKLGCRSRTEAAHKAAALDLLS